MSDALIQSRAVLLLPPREDEGRGEGGMRTDTVPALFRAQADRLGDRIALRELAAGGAPADAAVSWRDWAVRAEQFAAALIATGHEPGEAVAILAGNRLLWPIADLGTILARGVPVGIYPTSAPAQLRQILRDSGAVVVVVDTAEQLAKLQAIRADVPSIRTVVCQDTGSAAGTIVWDAWMDAGARARRDGSYADLQRREREASPDDTALLIYTSGSTGEPKGARISHRYLLASAASIAATLDLTDADSSLSFLPFCHAAERVFGLYARIHSGMEAGLVRDHTRMGDAAQAFGPTLFGGLPRFYEKAFEALRAEQQQAAGAERKRWERTLALGRTRSRMLQGGEPVAAALEAEWRALGEPLFARLRDMFGGRVRLATSGGAALPPEVAEYLHALDLPVLGAYGLTEHLCAAMNRSDHPRFDAAGPPMPGSTLRIAENGEILLRRGPLTFSGYHGRPDETRDTFSDDGQWLRTGDLGELDELGALRVTGRIKELIALSTGKKVAPIPIEARLVEQPWIGQAVLHGEGRKYIAALLTLRRPVVEAWARERDGDGALPHEYAELIRHPDVTARVQAAVDRVNTTVSRTEQVRRWTVLDRELSAEAGELTPTLKIRRPIVAEQFRERFDALYQEAP